MSASQIAYKKLKEYAVVLKKQISRSQLSQEKLTQLDQYRQNFIINISTDFQIPQALAGMWEMLKSNIPSTDKLDLLLEFDKVFGLNLDKVQEDKIPKDILEIAEKREEARRKGDFTLSDNLRKQIADQGYTIEDLEKGFKIKKS